MRWHEPYKSRGLGSATSNPPPRALIRVPTPKSKHFEVNLIRFARRTFCGSEGAVMRASYDRRDAHQQTPSPTATQL